MTTPSVCVLLLGALCGGDPLAPVDTPVPAAHGRPCHYPDEMWRPSLQQCVLKGERERPYRHDPRRVRVPHVASHTYKRHRHERKGRVIAADPSKEDRVIVHDPSRPSFFEEELIRKDEDTKKLFIERFKGREP